MKLEYQNRRGYSPAMASPAIADGCIFGRSDPQMAKHMSLLECLRLLGCRPE